MGSVLVVVLEVIVEDSCEMSRTEDEDLVDIRVARCGPCAIGRRPGLVLLLLRFRFRPLPRSVRIGAWCAAALFALASVGVIAIALGCPPVEALSSFGSGRAQQIASLPTGRIFT